MNPFDEFFAMRFVAFLLRDGAILVFTFLAKIGDSGPIMRLGSMDR